MCAGKEHNVVTEKDIVTNVNASANGIYEDIGQAYRWADPDA